MDVDGGLLKGVDLLKRNEREITVGVNQPGWNLISHGLNSNLFRKRAQVSCLYAIQFNLSTLWHRAALQKRRWVLTHMGSKRLGYILLDSLYS